MRILVTNGPNLNLLGTRQTGIYGHHSAKDLEDFLRVSATQLGCEIEIRQTNHEGVLVDWIQKAIGQQFDGIIINPGGYGHTSVALLDAVLAVSIPVVEVHISNLASREEFRRHSIVGQAAAGRVEGFGIDSYRIGMIGLVEILRNGER